MPRPLGPGPLGSGPRLSATISPKPITAFVDQANGTAIVVIQDGTAKRWAYLSSLEFNMAYWRGHTEEASYEVTADNEICYDQLGPSSVVPLPEALVKTDRVTFNVRVEPDRAYDLYYSVDAGAVQSVPLPAASPQLRSTITFDLPDGRVVWWFEARNGTRSCPPQHSSIYSFDHVRGGRQRAVRR